jgi:hypothetical protein
MKLTPSDLRGSWFVSRIRGGRTLVKDKNGGRFTIVKRECIETDIGPPRKLDWLELETGERVNAIDANTFVVIGSGKKLRRVRRVKEQAPRES